MGVMSALSQLNRKFFRPLLADERGQAITEYLILVAATVGLTAFFAKKILAGINTGVQTLAAQLEKDLKTGRMSIGYWKN